MAVFERPVRHRSRSGEAGGRYLSQGIGHDLIDVIVYTFSNQYTSVPSLLNDTKRFSIWFRPKKQLTGTAG